MTTVQEKAYAKINLGLNVLGERKDGYHEVAMVMQSIGLADDITIQEGEGITITTNLEGLSCGPDNLAHKAATSLASFAGITPNVHIHLDKHIFMSAGLAGGSTDAAAVLRGLNKFWGLDLSTKDLLRIAAELGSDIPFCIEGGTALATGRGEVITPLPDLPEAIVILAKPKGLEVSTPWVYNNYKEERVLCIPKIYRMCEHIKDGAHAIWPFFGNVLETVTIPRYPVIASMKAAMVSAGAYYAMMSGSGPTAFAFADSEEIAKKAVEALADFDVETAVTTTVGRGK